MAADPRSGAAATFSSTQSPTRLTGTGHIILLHTAQSLRRTHQTPQTGSTADTGTKTTAFIPRTTPHTLREREGEKKTHDKQQRD